MKMPFSFSSMRETVPIHGYLSFFSRAEKAKDDTEDSSVH